MVWALTRGRRKKEEDRPKLPIQGAESENQMGKYTVRRQLKPKEGKAVQAVTPAKYQIQWIPKLRHDVFLSLGRDTGLVPDPPFLGGYQGTKYLCWCLHQYERCLYSVPLI